MQEKKEKIAKTYVVKELNPDINDNGELFGYASTFGNQDVSGDVIYQGAFSKTLERINTKSIPLMAKHFIHGGDGLDVIGSVIEAKEDERGLLVRAVFASTQIAQDMRTLVKEKHIKSMSVGIQLIQYDRNGDGGYAITEAKLMEVTLTAFPSNKEADILSAKSEENADVDTVEVNSTENDAVETAEDSIPTVSYTSETAATDACCVLKRVNARLRILSI